MYKQAMQAVKENMKNMLNYSQLEYAQYKEKNDIVLLQQAGEKVFNALENYIQYVNEMQVSSFFELTKLVTDRKLKQLLYDGRNLHRFFYRAELEMDKEQAEELYLTVFQQTSSLIQTVA